MPDYQQLHTGCGGEIIVIRRGDKDGGGLEMCCKRCSDTWSIGAGICAPTSDFEDHFFQYKPEKSKAANAVAAAYAAAADYVAAADSDSDAKAAKQKGEC